MAVVYGTFAGQTVYENRGGAERIYVPDTLGSTAALTDASGTVTDSFSYWPYGEERVRTGTTPTPFRFVGTLGYYRDAVGRMYVRSRTYLAGSARWATVDPLWPKQPAYAYAAAMPNLRVDPSGLLAWCVAPCACAAACVIDLLAVCSDWSGFPSYGACLWQTFKSLPGWMQLLCGACIGGCIWCLSRRPPRPPIEPPVEPQPLPPGGPALPPGPQPLPPGPSPQPLPAPEPTPLPEPTPGPGPGLEPCPPAPPWWVVPPRLCFPICATACTAISIYCIFQNCDWDYPTCIDDCVSGCLAGR